MKADHPGICDICRLTYDRGEVVTRLTPGVFAHRECVRARANS